MKNHVGRNPSKKIDLTSCSNVTIHKRHYTLDTDASEIEIVCIPCQEQPSKTKESVGYWFRSLTKAKEDIQQNSTKIFGENMVSISTATQPQRMEVHHTDRSRLASVDTESSRRARKAHQVTTTVARVLLWRCSSSRRRTLSCWTTVLCPYRWYCRTSLEDDLFVIYINIVHNDKNNHPSLMLEEFSSTLMHLSSVKKGLEARTLTDFRKTQSGDFFYQEPVKHLSQSGTEFSR